MKAINRWCTLVIALCVACPAVSYGSFVVEIGDLNIINDPGNPSFGLRFLDMTFSDGKTLAAALADSQAAYPNARLATPSEWDDLFAAAGIMYQGSETASDAFTTGSSPVISLGTNYDAGALRSALGFTVTTGSGSTQIWSDPDGSNNAATTRDFIQLTSSQARILQSASLPANSGIGWMIVSEPATSTVIPEPSTLTLMGMGLTGALVLVWRRKRNLASEK